eukprot:10113685-Lingulodinium_polyedra.AAC.1
MKFSGCEEEACFLQVIACAELEAPVDALYSGPSFPKSVVFELTGNCVSRALDSHTSLGCAASRVLQQWSRRYGPMANLQDGQPPATCFQVPCCLAKLAARGLWQFIAMSPSSKLDRSCDLYCLRNDVQEAFSATSRSADLRSFMSAAKLIRNRVA